MLNLDSMYIDLMFTTQMVRSLRSFSNWQHKLVIDQSVSLCCEEGLALVSLDARAP